MVKNLNSRFIIAAAMAGAASFPANATPFNSALVAIYDSSTTGSGSCGSAPLDCSNTTSAPAVTATESYSNSGPGFTDSAYAQANLSTATLKVKASAATDDGSQHPYVQSNATFADGFTTQTASGSPFVWNATTATFTLNFGTSNVLDQGTDNNASAFVILGIDKKGSVTTDSNWFTGSDTITYFLYEFGNPTAAIGYSYDGTFTPLTITQGFTSIPTSIDATFAPGGDFDWVLLFGVSGQILGDGTSLDSSFNYDLSHTLTLQYEAPADTITTSDSGIFGGQAAVAVPEPITASLFGAGLIGAAFLRRRKKQKAVPSL